LSALIADRFSSGRVFLAGDAAHTLPPARGGYGANTGIEDAHNLAWKIGAVLSGASAPELLDTYDAERRPIAWLRHGQIFARPDYAQFARSADKDVRLIDDDAMELGQLYRSSAVIGAGEDLPPALPPDQWVGQPGTRAPHVWYPRRASGFRRSIWSSLNGCF
jgi:putative polyketide hydroxylase